ncbi:A/G-specific adenine glycosylase [Acetobacter sp.]|uniref:A/G-specific adenine glycosylase n=1 Tax=Acetobacter sp. TaxID=440 RepID=UPI0025BECFB0|nr:A/G-specific adenine glycosylase [Acetobacter sp.]MCH4092682.1 A/G-specific adenine glycosylase [Acetobacter sp.]MCI1301216.1 A/G-specific adenine glycosylase [Acetobacter sp.]MCI1317477.1 A/G-specific adenine glycosylase [Acetobacter sp.]
MIPSDSDLLAWYDHNRRTLPWRALPGETADPYHVWISEIMLQQTTVAAVIPYYHNFLERFPDIRALARAPLDEVLQAWSGLGYYSRARNLHRCAEEVVHLGEFPRDVAGLQALPGIGAYTAAAIAAIAFGVPVVPVDGNVERISARIFAMQEPMPGARKQLAAKAVTLNAGPQAQARASDFAQALFDLGATLCVPRSPACVLCPWRKPCKARKLGIQAELPKKSPKAERPTRHGVHFLLMDEADQVLVRRRPPQGLLGGTIELPGPEWREKPWSVKEVAEVAPFADRASGGLRVPQWECAGSVRHVFTHFTLLIDVYAARVRSMPNPREEEGFPVALEKVDGLALSSLMRKCVQTGLKGSD